MTRPVIHRTTPFLSPQGQLVVAVPDKFRHRKVAVVKVPCSSRWPRRRAMAPDLLDDLTHVPAGYPHAGRRQSIGPVLNLALYVAAGLAIVGATDLYVRAREIFHIHDTEKGT